MFRMVAATLFVFGLSGCTAPTPVAPITAVAPVPAVADGAAALADAGAGAGAGAGRVVVAERKPPEPSSIVPLVTQPEPSLTHITKHKGGCGSRGGAGYRLANGKCASRRHGRR